MTTSSRSDQAKTIADEIVEYKATRGSAAVKMLHRVLAKIIGLECPHCGKPVNVTIDIEPEKIGANS